jgi:hypothetical protein
MKKRDRVVLNQCPTWWNVETRDGMVCASFESKMVARFFQRIANHKSFALINGGQMNTLLRLYGQWLAFYNDEVIT